jgi:hypothetical protein
MNETQRRLKVIDTLLKEVNEQATQLQIQHATAYHDEVFGTIRKRATQARMLVDDLLNEIEED